MKLDQTQVQTVKTVQAQSKLALLSKEQTLRKQFIESRKELQADIRNNTSEHEISVDAKRKDYMRNRKSESRPRRATQNRDGPEPER